MTEHRTLAPRSIFCRIAYLVFSLLPAIVFFTTIAFMHSIVLMVEESDRQCMIEIIFRIRTIVFFSIYSVAVFNVMYLIRYSGLTTKSKLLWVFFMVTVPFISVPLFWIFYQSKFSWKKNRDRFNLFL